MILSKNIKISLIKIFIFLLILLIIIIFVPFDFYKFENNIDNSWAIGLNLAIKNNFIFGKDIIFTYGPLGYLMTGLPFYVSIFNIFIFRLFLIVNSFYFIKYSYNYFGINFIFLIPLFLFVNFLFSSHIDLSLFFFFLFNLFLYSKNGNFLNLFTLLVISLLSLYIKLNTGIIINIIFIISIIYFKKPKYILVYFVYFLVHFFLIINLKIDIISYFLNGFEIINYYNDAMYIPSKFNALIIALIIVFILFIFAFYNFYKGLFLDIKFIKYHISLSLFYLFVLFKQSFVRADIGHNQTFFIAVPYLFLLQSFFLKKSNINNFRLNYFFLIFIIIYLFFINKQFFLKNNIQYNFKFFNIYENNYNAFLKTSSFDILPDRFLKVIKNNSVDIFPSDINVIYFNKLNYIPRPIIQSYSAYSNKFLYLNFEKYNSKSGPEFIIYHDGVKIDKQHPFWQDSFAELAMIKNYDLIDSFTFKNNKSLLLFKKNNKKIVLKKKLIIETSASLNTSILIPKSDNLIFMECEIEHTLIGKLVRFFYQPSPLNIKLFDSNNNSNIVKGVIPVLGSGVLINKALLNNDGTLNSSEIYNLIKKKGYTKNNYINDIIFIGNSRYIKNKFKIKFYDYCF
jgi:hypothetical protein